MVNCNRIDGYMDEVIYFCEMRQLGWRALCNFLPWRSLGRVDIRILNSELMGLMTKVLSFPNGHISPEMGH